jgi:hypothetical protein
LNDKKLFPSLNILKKKVNLEDVVFSFCLDKDSAEFSKRKLIEGGFAFNVDIDPISRDSFNL